MTEELDALLQTEDLDAIEELVPKDQPRTQGLEGFSDTEYTRQNAEMWYESEEEETSLFFVLLPRGQVGI